MAASDWFLDRNGRKSGPYSVEQVLTLLQKGEITSEHRATAEWLCGEWITVGDLVSGYEAAQGKPAEPPPSAASSEPRPKASAPAASARAQQAPAPESPAKPKPQLQAESAEPRGSSGFQPPPRPLELSEASSSPSPPDEESPVTGPDPAQGLFDVLQAAKDRKNSVLRGSTEVFAPPPQTHSAIDLLEKTYEWIATHTKLLGLTLVAAVVLVIGIRVLISKKTETQKAQSSAAVTTEATKPGSTTTGGIRGSEQSFARPQNPPQSPSTPPPQAPPNPGILRAGANTFRPHNEPPPRPVVESTPNRDPGIPDDYPPSAENRDNPAPNPDAAGANSAPPPPHRPGPNAQTAGAPPGEAIQDPSQDSSQPGGAGGTTPVSASDPSNPPAVPSEFDR